MKKLILVQYLLAIMFVVIGVALFLTYKAHRHDPPLLGTNQEFVRSVQSSQDIEHLRKLVLSVAAEGDKAVVTNVEATDAAVSVAVSFCGVATMALLVCAALARKIAKGKTPEP